MASCNGRTLSIGSKVVLSQGRCGTIIAENGHAYKIETEQRFYGDDGVTWKVSRCWFHRDDVPPQFCLSIEADWCNLDGATWADKWNNAFTSVSPVAAACLHPPDEREWHPPTYDSYCQEGVRDPRLQALIAGDLGEVQRLFKEPRDLLCWEVDGVEGAHDSSLHLAFQHCNVDILKHLVNLSPMYFMQVLTMGSLEGCSGGRRHPLKNALTCERHDVVRWMCDNGIMTDTVFEECGETTMLGEVQTALDVVAKKIYLWTPAGIDGLIELGILLEPGKPKLKDPDTLREGEENPYWAEGVVAGVAVNRDVFYSLDELIAQSHVIEAPPEMQAKRVKSESELILENWRALPDTERKQRTESFFADLFWPMKKVVAIGVLSSPESNVVEFTCTAMRGEALGTAKANEESDHVADLLGKIAFALGEPRASLEIVLPNGKSLNSYDPTAPLSKILPEFR